MSKLTRWMWGSLIALLLATVGAFAQAPVDARERPVYGQRELDTMLAPVALYPDSLLSQVLMAATYPLEVVQAARWSRSHPELLGDEAVRAVAEFDWDPSVKSLVAFPQVLQQMDEKLDWTETLGDAFLAQEDQVMRTVQQLRGRADAAGNLRSTDELVVERRGDDFILDSPSPEVVYVPYYDPRVIYGPWWWPGYDPVYWGPWPGYPFYAGYAGFGWSLGVPVGVGFFFGAFDWPRRFVRFGSHRPFYLHSDARWSPSHRWRHDPGHRHGVPYRYAGSGQRLARDTVRNGWTGRSDRVGGRIARAAGAAPIPATPLYRAGRASRDGGLQGAPRLRGTERPRIIQRPGGTERAQGIARAGGMERWQRPQQAAPRQSPRTSPLARPASPPQYQYRAAPQRQSAPAPGAAARPSARSASHAGSRGGGERSGPARQDR